MSRGSHVVYFGLKDCYLELIEDKALGGFTSAYRPGERAFSLYLPGRILVYASCMVYKLPKYMTKLRNRNMKFLKHVTDRTIESNGEKIIHTSYEDLRWMANQTDISIDYILSKH